jgi:ABC-type dipeptide/oligopeptide/nickel transport system permease subunit
VLFATLLLFAVIVPLSEPGPDEQALAERLTGPGASHLMGTDQLGRDQMSRIAEAVGGSLATAAVVTLVAGAGGGLLGLASGYLGGKTDLVFQRLVDALMALPLTVAALAVVAAVGATFWSISLAIAVSFAPLSIRVARSSALSARETGFVQYARISGAPAARVITRHFVPLALGPWAIVAASQAGGAILAEAALGFLGAVPPGRISLGSLLGGEAQTHMYTAPWLIIWPGVALALLGLAANLVGEWLAARSSRPPGS